MDKQTKTNVKNLVLSLRDDFEKEIENRLSHIGIYNDREWKDGRSLPHLAEDELGRKELDKRRRVAAFIKREEKLGLSLEEATSEFIKECSYTWINRLLGLKCMECQGIIEEVITTRLEFSNRSRVHRDFRETHPEIASKADDGLTATLFSVFEQVTDEIKILFDPSNEYSLIIPRYAMLKRSIEKINAELDYETYRADDFLGWVYQYFNSREKARVDEEVRTKKKKISGSDIINVTQLYTEKYMVHFLVENSLGAMWMEMYPDSHLSNNWEYFVKDPNNSTRETKPVKEITFLDPACGSGHFLLYAFDLYYDMYLEEGAIPRDQIPDHILKYNLHGIDIDQRAIQLTALGLFMKAKSKNPDVKVQHMNLVSADAIMQDKDIEEFLQEFEGDRIAQKLIRTIWEGLENVRELGSLLKIEEQIDALIEQKKDKRLDFYEDSTQKNWDQWKQDLLNSIKRYYEKASQSFDLNRQMFANEAYKGVQILDLLEQRYDIVATNPPYMGHKNYGNTLKTLLDSSYKNNSTDLYQCFIVRCIELNKPEGFFSMICQKSFLFLNTFTDTRKLILSQCQVKTLVLLGPGAFEDVGGEVVNTTMFSLKKTKKSNFESIFFDVSKLITKESELKKFILSNKNVVLNQRDFTVIDDYPFVFWIKEIDSVAFKKYKPLDNKTHNASATAKQGLITGNNDKFLRYTWETTTNNNWVPYMKGGEPNKWYGNQNYMVNWSNNGEKIKNYVNEKGKLLSRPQNSSYYFKEGITYSTTSSFFAARYMPNGFIFDAKASSVFLVKYGNIYYLLGFLNSKVAINLLNLLTPSLDFNVGYTQKIPFKLPTKEIESSIERYVKLCVEIKKYALQFTVTSQDFQKSAIIHGYEVLKKLDK